jgi:hypothetical protein
MASTSPFTTRASPDTRKQSFPSTAGGFYTIRSAIRFAATAACLACCLSGAGFSTASASVQAAPAVDSRFGLVGTGGAAFAAKFGFKYYTLEGNYADGKGTVFSSVDPANDPAAGFSVVREAAKLNVRTDALGQTNAQFQAKLNQYAKDLATWYITPSWARGSKPAFAWYSPNANALIQAESLQIVRTLRREKAATPAITGTVWEIGNEPNLFPAITPAEYAAIFANYLRVIKAEDPAAVVAMGSIFMPEPCEDLKAKLGEELESKMRAELQTAGYYNTLVSMGVFPNLVNDLKNTLLSRMLALPAKEYLRQVLAATSARPDLVTLHVYPYDDRAPFQDSAALRSVLDTTVAGINAMLASVGAVAPLWVTEFGNIEQSLAEQQVADRTRRLIGAFSATSAIAMWFHYKSTGSDDQFALFSSGPAPLTRLAVDAAFAPASGDFPCSRLNAVGKAYWKESHGGDCLDPNPPPRIDSLAFDASPIAEGDSARLRAFASDAQGEALTYLWIRRDGDTLGSSAEIVYRAGFEDAGYDTLTLTVKDAAGGAATRKVSIRIVNTYLRPAILNAEASALKASESISWGWEKIPDPDLETASMMALLEIFRDTAAAPLHRADSLKTGSFAPQLDVGSGTLWVRVRLRDAAGTQTPWSPWRRLNWEAAHAAAKAKAKAGKAPKAPMRNRPGVDIDLLGRFLIRPH